MLTAVDVHYCCYINHRSSIRTGLLPRLCNLTACTICSKQMSDWELSQQLLPTTNHGVGKYGLWYKVGSTTPKSTLRRINLSNLAYFVVYSHNFSLLTFPYSHTQLPGPRLFCQQPCETQTIYKYPKLSFKMTANILIFFRQIAFGETRAQAYP